MALVPQLSLFYDQLLLWLIPGTRGRALLLTAASWGAWGLWYPSHALPSSVAAARPWILALIYTPALLMLLTSPRDAARAPRPDEAQHRPAGGTAEPPARTT
jgi:hypothetical protein